MYFKVGHRKEKQRKNNRRNEKVLQDTPAAVIASTQEVEKCNRNASGRERTESLQEQWLEFLAHYRAAVDNQPIRKQFDWLIIAKGIYKAVARYALKSVKLGPFLPFK